MRLARHLGLLIVLVLAMTRIVAAHDGPHLARVITDVVAVRTEGREVRLLLQMEALQSAVTLVAASAGFAETLGSAPGPTIRPEEPVRHKVHLRFRDEVPDLFTLTLDFGEAGLGTVLVVAR